MHGLLRPMIGERAEVGDRVEGDDGADRAHGRGRSPPCHVETKTRALARTAQEYGYPILSVLERFRKIYEFWRTIAM